jgi:hypothetical protein
MPRNAPQPIARESNLALERCVMKKTSSTGTTPTRPRKSGAARSMARPATGSSPPADAASCVRLEITPPTALAVLQPARSPGRVALRRVRFGVFNPDAREVHVAGSFNGWDPRATALRRDALGDWSVEIELPRGEHRYRFFVDGAWCDDPSAQQTAQNPFGGFDAIMVVV